jgi:hypothetical protein
MRLSRWGWAVWLVVVSVLVSACGSGSRQSSKAPETVACSAVAQCRGAIRDSYHLQALLPDKGGFQFLGGTIFPPPSQGNHYDHLAELRVRDRGTTATYSIKIALRRLADSEPIDPAACPPNAVEGVVTTPAGRSACLVRSRLGERGSSVKYVTDRLIYVVAPELQTPATVATTLKVTDSLV